jgi:hypothetical protein
MNWSRLERAGMTRPPADLIAAVDPAAVDTQTPEES